MGGQSSTCILLLVWELSHPCLYTPSHGGINYGKPCYLRESRLARLARLVLSQPLLPLPTSFNDEHWQLG